MENNKLNIELILSDYDIIDFLSKLSALQVLVRTDFFVDYESFSENYHELNYALNYFLPYFFTHKIKTGTIKVNYDKLMDIVIKLFQADLNRVLNGKSIDNLTNSFDYTQNESGELLPYFFCVPFACQLEGENELISEKYSISSKDIYNDFCKIYERFHSLLKTERITSREFVENFSSYMSEKNFLIPKETHSYQLFYDMSCEIGAIDGKYFDESAPMATIKRARILFLRKNDSLYCFNYEIIPNLIVRCVERALQTNKKINEKWNRNMQIRTESTVEKLLSSVFKYGIYHKNVFFKTDKRREADGLFEFGSYVFLIEVKSGKLSPDSALSDNNSVAESFQNVIGKASSQLDQAEKNIIQGEGIFEKEDGTKIVIKSEQRKIIKLVVSFEDMSSILPDFNIGKNQNSTIYITYYDLLIVLDIISNPLLLLLYFIDRKTMLDRAVRITDEMIYLQLFMKNLFYPSQINNTIKESRAEHSFSDVHLDPSNFAHEIEMYYMNPSMTKPSIVLNDFQKIVFSSFSQDSLIALDNYLVLLVMNQKESDSFLNKFYDHNINAFAPQGLYAQYDGKGVGVIFSKKYKGDERYVFYAFVNRFFKKHSDTEKVLCIFIDDEISKSKSRVIGKSEPALHYKKTLDASNIEDRYKIISHKIR